jgi:hypothetical protein
MGNRSITLTTASLPLVGNQSATFVIRTVLITRVFISLTRILLRLEVSNILVIKNPERPEDEGKVFLFRYGKQIFSKIEQKMYPKKEDVEKAQALGEKYLAFEPLDIYEGANFKLVSTPQGTGEKIFPDYKDSSFYPQSALANGNEEEIDKIMAQTFLVSEFEDPKLYPLNEDTEKVVGHLWNGGVVSEEAPPESIPEPSFFTPDDDPSDVPFFDSEVKEIASEKTPTLETSEDDDYFGNLAKQ